LNAIMKCKFEYAHSNLFLHRIVKIMSQRLEQEAQPIDYCAVLKGYLPEAKEYLFSLDQLITESELTRFYQSFRRVSRIMGRPATLDEIAWEQTQLHPEAPVCPETVSSWNNHHEVLCITLASLFLPLADRLKGYGGDIQDELEKIIDHALRFNLRIQSATDLLIYFRVTFGKYGIAYRNGCTTYSDLLESKNHPGELIDEDRSHRLPAQPDSTADLEVLERVCVFCKDTGIGDIGDQQIRALYHRVGLVGTLQHIAERIGIDVDEVLKVRDESQGNLDKLQPQKKRPRRFITIRKNGTRVTDGWLIDQVYNAIFRLPLEFRWLVLLEAGYIGEDKSLKDLESEFWHFRKGMGHNLVNLIEQSLVANSQHQFNLKDVLDNLQLPETLAEIRRRKGFDLPGQRHLFKLHSPRMDMAFRILRALDNDHLLALDKVDLSPRQQLVFQQLMQNSGRLGFGRHRDFGYSCMPLMSNDIIRGLNKVIASLDFSFSKARETVVSALAENIGFLSAQEKRVLTLHYGLETGSLQTIGSLAKLLDQQRCIIWRRVCNACVKISAHLVDLNCSHFIPLRPLTQHEITDLNHEKLFLLVKSSPFYARLGLRQRAVLEARYLDGKTRISDIAEDLGMLEVTVRTNLYHGRKRIAKLHRQLLAEKDK